MNFTPVTSSRGPHAGQGTASPSAQTGAEPPLLPDPSASTVGAGDAMALLYLFEAKDQALGVEQGSRKVAALQTERNQALQKELQAITHEDDAAKSHGFWDDLGSILGDVAKVAGVVASIAAVVCTLGAATPLVVVAVAGAILSSASLADGQFHFLQKLGVDPSTAGWIDLGMALGGCASSMGSSLAAGAQAAAEASSAVTRLASVASGAATIGHGAASIAGGEAQADGTQAAADEVLAQAQSDHVLRFTQIVIAEIRASDDESRQVLSTIATIKGTFNQTATTAAISVRG